MDSSLIHRLLIIFLILISPQAKAIEFQGKFIQGHFILGKTDPKAKIIVDKKEVKVSEDGFFDRKFDYMITNPPFGVSWKSEENFIKQEEKNSNGRFSVGTPRTSDGSLLFLQHLLLFIVICVATISTNIHTKLP